MKCVAVTPEKTVFDLEIEAVVLPLFDGEYGVEANHSPVVGRIGAGELRMTLKDKSIERWYVEGGFVEVANNVVSLLTNCAYQFNLLNVDEARDAFNAALALPSNSPELAEIKNESVALARARLSAAEKAQALVRK